MENDRDKLKAIFKHMADYSRKFIIQILFNSWKMLVTQTLIFPLITLIATGILYAYYEVFSRDDMPKNLKAIAGMLSITLGVIFITNIIRSVFQLDRERVEELEQKEVKISGLKGKIESLENQANFYRSLHEPILPSNAVKRD